MAKDSQRGESKKLQSKKLEKFQNKNVEKKVDDNYVKDTLQKAQKEDCLDDGFLSPAAIAFFYRVQRLSTFGTPSSLVTAVVW
jgi:hypothetical protein